MKTEAEIKNPSILLAAQQDGERKREREIIAIIDRKISSVKRHRKQFTIQDFISQADGALAILDEVKQEILND